MKYGLFAVVCCTNCFRDYNCTQWQQLRIILRISTQVGPKSSPFSSLKMSCREDRDRTRLRYSPNSPTNPLLHLQERLGWNYPAGTGLPFSPIKRYSPDPIIPQDIFGTASGSFLWLLQPCIISTRIGINLIDINIFREKKNEKLCEFFLRQLN